MDQRPYHTPHRGRHVGGKYMKDDSHGMSSGKCKLQQQ